MQLSKSEAERTLTDLTVLYKVVSLAQKQLIDIIANTHNVKISSFDFL